MAALKETELRKILKDTLDTPAQPSPAYADMPIQHLDVVLGVVYGLVAEQIWKLNRKSTTQTFAGLTASRLIGRQRLPLLWKWDDDLPAFTSPDMLISTPPVLEQQTEKQQVPVSLGWAFSVRGDLPEIMPGGAPLRAFLRPYRGEITIQRTARSGDTIEWQDFYSVCDNGNQGAEVVGHTGSVDELVAGLRNHLEGAPLSPEYEARKLAAAQHALQLATDALPILQNGY